MITIQSKRADDYYMTAKGVRHGITIKAGQTRQVEDTPEWRAALEHQQKLGHISILTATDEASVESVGVLDSVDSEPVELTETKVEAVAVPAEVKAVAVPAEVKPVAPVTPSEPKAELGTPAPVSPIDTFRKLGGQMGASVAPVSDEPVEDDKD